MKKLLLIALMGLSVRAYADTKISAFTSTTTLNTVDIIPVVTNPSGSAANRSITKTNLAATLDILTQSSATATYLQPASLTATQPVLYNSSTKVISATPVSLSTGVVGLLPVANGGTGTATPTITAGTNITSITGTWPNVTINADTQAGGSGGIVSPGTFTWTNTTYGLSVSTIVVSTITANQIPYAGGVGGGLIGSPTLTYFSSSSVGALGHENLIHKGYTPFYVFASSNAMGINFFDAYEQYQNANLWGSLSVHPNAFPTIAQGSGNLYMRDGSNLQLDVTGQNGYNKGTIQLRSSDENNEGTPHVGFQYDSTRTVVVTDITNNVDGISGYGRWVTHDYSAVLEASSTTRGFLPPRMTTTQKNAIVSPAAGLMVYDTTLSTMTFYNGSSWLVFGGGGGGSGTPGGSTGQVQYNSAGSFAGVTGSFVTASSMTLTEVKVSSLSVNSNNTLQRIDITQSVPDASQPAGTLGTVSDPHAAILLGDSSLTNFRKLGIEWTGYRSGTDAYVYGGLFGQMTASSGNTIGKMSFDMRRYKDDTALTEFLVIDSSGGVTVSTGPLTVAGYTLLQSSMGVTGAGGITSTYGVAAATGAFTTSLTVAGQNVCQANGTNCPTSSGGSSSLEVMVGGVRLSSPTATVSLIAGSNITLTPSLVGGTTAQITIASSGGGSGDNLGNHIATMTVTAGYGLTSTTGTFSSTVQISSVATITALVLGTTNYAAYGSSGTITPDATMGNNISITLTSSATINVPINAQDFEMFRYRIAQDSAGGRTVFLGSDFAFGTDVSSATFSTAASKVDYLSCIYYSATSKCHIVAPVIRGY